LCVRIVASVPNSRGAVTDELDRCPNCQKTLEFQRFNAGFGSEGYVYCGTDATVVTWNSYDPIYSAISDNRHPWLLGSDGRQAVEAALRRCPCGGSFLFVNVPRCPHCGEQLPGLAADPTYYVVLARRIDGDETPIWKPSVT